MPFIVEIIKPEGTTPRVVGGYVITPDKLTLYKDSALTLISVEVELTDEVGYAIYTPEGATVASRDQLSYLNLVTRKLRSFKDTYPSLNYSVVNSKIYFTASGKDGVVIKSLTEMGVMITTPRLNSWKYLLKVLEELEQ